MILTLTLNPALDVSGTVLQLIPNEKAYVENEMRMPGGNGINAARIASRLGAQVCATGFLGGSAGEEVRTLLKKENLDQHFISVKGSTRTNITISLKKGSEQTRLSFPGPKIQKNELLELEKFIFKNNPSLIVIGGSLPLGIRPIFLKRIISKFNQLNIPILLDVPGSILRELNGIKPYMIKPNIIEYQEMTGTKCSKLNEVLEVAKKISASIPVQCISSVEGGALLVTSEHAWFGKTPRLNVQSSVGAGDSMVGAMAHALVKMKFKMTKVNCEKMFRLGLAASSATLSNKGLTMGSRKMIQYYVPKIVIKKLY